MVANHVLEHVPDPIALVMECVRVCRPGGRVYLEAPPERSLWLPGVPFRHDLFCSFSYYDDPTHNSRPWTPQSLYRLARYLGCAYALTEKPASLAGKPQFKYYIPSRRG